MRLAAWEEDLDDLWELQSLLADLRFYQPSDVDLAGHCGGDEG
jgi:hypothetical protein